MSSALPEWAERAGFRRLARTLLPQSLRRLIGGRPLLARLLGNSAWQIGDSLFRMGTGVVVSAYVARYLGPPGFGLINLGVALFTLFTAVAQFGMNTIVVRDLIERPDERRVLLGSALLLRLAGGVASIALAVGASALIRPGDYRCALVVLIIAASAMPRAWDIIDYDYQSRIHSGPVVVARNLSFIILAGVRVLMVVMRAPLEWFAAAITAEAALATVLLLRRWRADGLQVGVGSAAKKELWQLLTTGWPLVIAGMSISVYMRIDQVMLGRMVGDSGVGLFSAAVRVSEALYFLPLAACTSVAPALTAARRRSVAEYERRMLSVMRVLVWLALGVALIFAVLSRAIIHALYGPAYAGAAAVLSIHAWVGVLVSMSLCSNQWLSNEGYLKYTMYQTLAGAAVNVILNLSLIPWLGVVGAALASCAGQLVSVVLTTGILPRTRRLLTLQLAALVPLYTPSFA
ncbi:MAG: flippase [Gammaproteobacteria bacterium]|nr:flippase [Gammaproteobacteria bacterium]